MKKIVLIEFIDEFEMFRKYVQKKGSEIEEYTIVALDCKLQAYLLRLGIGFKDPLYYLSDDYYKRILLKFDEIRVYIEDNFNFTDENDLRFSYVIELQFYIEFIFLYIAKALEILQGIYNKDSSIELFACTTYYVSDSVIIEDDRFLGPIVQRFAKTKNIKFYSFGSIEKFNKGHASTERTNKNSKISHILLNIIKYYLKIFKKVPILIPTKGYGFDKLMCNIRKKYPNVIYITLFNKKKGI